ncbi:unnamed protein product [Larinioides sclopetarius]|uniref:Phospholipase A2-like central domain-containing protein n=1 Tax=Larinioides sclopetarius TaxID=280406 RepID=A0AAV2ABZ4_9ARAC
MTSWRWIHFEMGEEFSNMKMISLTHPAPLLPPVIREGGRQQTISASPQFFHNRSSGLAGTPPARFRLRRSRGFPASLNRGNPPTKTRGRNIFKAILNEIILFLSLLLGVGDTHKWVTLFLLTAATTGETRRPPWLRTIGNDFVCTRVLPDGEVERRIQKGRISAIETTVELPPDSTDSPYFSTSSQAREFQILTLLQVTDGRHFIQLIYDSGWELRDCEYLKSAKSVDEFFEAFAGDVNCPRQKQILNETRSPTDPEGRLDIVKPDVTDYGALRRECRTLHKKVRELTLHNNHHGLQRLKRDLFLYPGTNWCGSGSNARKFNELGYNAAADRCCRDHDHCPYTIEGFTRKFNFFNFRFHTISHCDCDER